MTPQTIGIAGLLLSAAASYMAVRRSGNLNHWGQCFGHPAVVLLAMLAMPNHEPAPVSPLTRIDVRGLPPQEVQAVQSIAIGMLKRK